MKVQPCRGCAACHKTGECVIQDDFKQIKDSLLAADGVVLASPNYIFSVTAQMKAMMDRCSCPLHCQAMEGKYGAAVVTSGGGGEEVEAYLLRFLRALGCRTVGGVTAEARQLEDERTRGPKCGEAAILGARLVEAIRTRAKFPEQDNERAAFSRRMKELVGFRKDEWPYEYNYWKSHGRI
jgi:multimeric flavodoxin WrbA